MPGSGAKIGMYSNVYLHYLLDRAMIDSDCHSSCKFLIIFNGFGMNGIMDCKSATNEPNCQPVRRWDVV